MTELPNIPNLEGLEQLARRDGVDIRPTLLRVMTDLYVQKAVHSPEEEQHFTELALRLFDLVDPSTRTIVTERLAGYAGAPVAVRQRLLRENITLTAPPAAAEREPRADPFAGSRAAADELSELFFAASPDERRLILINLPYAPLQPAQPIDPALAGASVHRLEAAALGHNNELFARELERTLQISRAQARRLIDDASGEPIVVAAIALRMAAAVLQRILLCLNPAISQSVQRVYELADLYEEIETEAALRLLAIWQAAHKATKNEGASRILHQPHHWPAEDSTRAAAAAAPAARQQIRWEQHAQARKSERA